MRAYGQRHHIGTTRMHVDPKNGVVNEHCRVHGLKNLYVAGSSVFPTSGLANPTLTITALALKLSDYLVQHATLGGWREVDDHGYERRPKMPANQWLVLRNG